MRIASRAVRFVRLDLRASLRPRFVRLVPPGGSLPRAAAAQVVVPPRHQPPDAVHAASEGPWGVCRLPRVPLGPSHPRRTRCRRRTYVRRRLGLSESMAAALVVPPLRYRPV